MRKVDRCQIGKKACRNLPRFAPQSLSPAQCRTDIKALTDRAVFFNHDVAGNVAQALTVFQCAQLLGQADADVAVGPDPERPACGEPARPVERPIPQISLGDRTQPGNRTAFCQCRRFLRRHVGGVDRTPIRPNGGVGQQPFHRPRPQPCRDIGHFLGLFCDVDVNGISRSQR